MCSSAQRTQHALPLRAPATGGPVSPACMLKVGLSYRQGSNERALGPAPKSTAPAAAAATSRSIGIGESQSDRGVETGEDTALEEGVIR